MVWLPFLGNSEVTFWDIEVHLPLGCPFRNSFVFADMRACRHTDKR